MKPNEYRIEYEIPPLRAIYFAEITAGSEADAREVVTALEPKWRIRKIVKLDSIET